MQYTLEIDTQELVLQEAVNKLRTLSCGEVTLYIGHQRTKDGIVTTDSRFIYASGEVFSETVTTYLKNLMALNKMFDPVRIENERLTNFTDVIYLDDCLFTITV
jgi:hypothetical protein